MKTQGVPDRLQRMLTMKKSKFLLLGLLAILAVTILPSSVYAEGGAGFTMEAAIPDNQVGTSTYFDLHVKPDTKQNLTIKFTNLEDKAIKLNVSPNPAFTNRNGVIEYSQYKYPKDDSAKYTIPELFSKPQDITLKAKEVKDVTFTMTTPKQAFDGMILGGFYALRDDENKTQSSGNIQIDNRYALVLGVALREDLKKTIEPELKLNAIKPGLDNSRTAVFANLQNIKPQAFGEMTVDAKVYQKGSDKVYKATKKDKQEMSPNSNYDFAIDWKNQPIEAGDYHLSLVATSGKKEWKFEQDFTIADKGLQKINEEAVGLPEKNYLWLYILIAVLLLLILVILAFILGRKKRKEDEDDTKTE